MRLVYSLTFGLSLLFAVSFNVADVSGQMTTENVAAIRCLPDISSGSTNEPSTVLVRAADALPRPLHGAIRPLPVVDAQAKDGVLPGQLSDKEASSEPQVVDEISERSAREFAQAFSAAYDLIHCAPQAENRIAVDSNVEETEYTAGPGHFEPDSSEFVEEPKLNVPQITRLPSEYVEVDDTIKGGATEPFVPDLGALEPELPTSDRLPYDFNSAIQREYDDALWWKQLVNRPLGEATEVEPTDTNTLIYAALANSPRIQAISKDPLIRELQVTEAESEFDAVSFLSSQFDDRNDPVGNTLTTGGAPFLQDNIWSGEAGVRKKLATGANFELGQRIGFQNSNSRFFVPQDQGTATLSLNFTQPLLRGRGRTYNQSQILIAQSAGGVAWESFRGELQTELESVVQAYWRLYFHRSVYLQKKRNVARGEMVLNLLLGRSELDSLPTQITRAKSAVLSRETDLVSALNDVRNSETEIRRLIADPNWISSQNIELLPLEPALQTAIGQTLTQVVEIALENRPEIQETLQRAKIAAIQYNVSTNELLPDLSLLLHGYISALEGDSGIELALQRQFKNTPGYTVGFEFEFPINNRAARSRLAQRDVQRSKIANEVNETMQSVIADAQLAFRRLTTAHQTMEAAKSTIDAARMDLAQNHQRWASFALVEGDLAEGHSPTIVLDQLLDSQDRLAIAEFVFAQTELELKVSEVGLRRVTGTLLVHERVTYSTFYENGTPSVGVEREPAFSSEAPLETSDQR